MVPDDHPASKLPRRRLAMLRPGMVVPGVITRLVRGGALVDILLESGEPAFVPLTEIPAKSMPKVRDLMAQGTLQEVRLMQLDRAAGTATASLKGLIEDPADLEEDEDTGRGGRPGRGAPRRPVPAPPPPPATKTAAKPAAPAGPPKISASERARRQQEEILKRLRGDG
jgi:predicted RNA-binding protein with RPS1 domain